MLLAVCRALLLVLCVLQQYVSFLPSCLLLVPCVSAPSVARWRQETFEWSRELRERNRAMFGNRDFRLNQLAIMNATLSGRDVFVLMPTGALVPPFPAGNGAKIWVGRCNGCWCIALAALSMVDLQA